MIDSYQKETMVHESQRYNLMLLHNGGCCEHLNRLFITKTWFNDMKGSALIFVDIATLHDIQSWLPDPALEGAMITTLNTTYPNTHDIRLHPPPPATMHQLTDCKLSDFNKISVD